MGSSTSCSPVSTQRTTRVCSCEPPRPSSASADVRVASRWTAASYRASSRSRSVVVGALAGSWAVGSMRLIVVESPWLAMLYSSCRSSTMRPSSPPRSAAIAARTDASAKSCCIAASAGRTARRRTRLPRAGRRQPPARPIAAPPHDSVPARVVRASREDAQQLADVEAIALLHGHRLDAPQRQRLCARRRGALPIVARLEWSRVATQRARVDAAVDGASISGEVHEALWIVWPTGPRHTIEAPCIRRLLQRACREPLRVEGLEKHVVKLRQRRARKVHLQVREAVVALVRVGAACALLVHNELLDAGREGHTRHLRLPTERLRAARLLHVVKLPNLVVGRAKRDAICVADARALPDVREQLEEIRNDVDAADHHLDVDVRREVEDDPRIPRHHHDVGGAASVEHDVLGVERRRRRDGLGEVRLCARGAVLAAARLAVGHGGSLGMVVDHAPTAVVDGHRLVREVPVPRDVVWVGRKAVVARLATHDVDVRARHLAALGTLRRITRMEEDHDTRVAARDGRIVRGVRPIAEHVALAAVVRCGIERAEASRASAAREPDDAHGAASESRRLPGHQAREAREEHIGILEGVAKVAHHIGMHRQVVVVVRRHGVVRVARQVLVAGEQPAAAVAGHTAHTIEHAPRARRTHKAKVEEHATIRQPRARQLIDPVQRLPRARVVDVPLGRDARRTRCLVRVREVALLVLTRVDVVALRAVCPPVDRERVVVLRHTRRRRAVVARLLAPADDARSADVAEDGARLHDGAEGAVLVLKDLGVQRRGLEDVLLALEGHAVRPPSARRLRVAVVAARHVAVVRVAVGVRPLRVEARQPRVDLGEVRVERHRREDEGSANLVRYEHGIACLLIPVTCGAARRHGVGRRDEGMARRGAQRTRRGRCVQCPRECAAAAWCT
eukprot:7381437-Prymnesium_polylepis.1